jgi:hypothetical protein
MGMRQLVQYEAKLSGGLRAPFQLAGAPTSGAGGSFAARASVGSQLIDTVAGKLYACTAAGGGSVTWVLVGAQT